MTTISGISSSLLSVFQLNQTSGVKQASGASGQCETGDVQGNRPPGPPPGGGLADAIMQALSDIGATGQSSSDGSSSSTGTSSSSDSSTASTASTASADSQSIAQAFGAFMHNLIGALHAQSESGTAADASQDSGNSDVAQVQGGHHHHGGPGNIQSDLQSLIQKLSSSSSDSTSSASSTPSSLQQSFSSLLSALGASNGDATLNKFLQALQNDLPGVTSSGNIVNTTA